VPPSQVNPAGEAQTEAPEGVVAIADDQRVAAGDLGLGRDTAVAVVGPRRGGGFVDGLGQPPLRVRRPAGAAVVLEGRVGARLNAM
jgi:hypothetical protein